MPGYDDELLDAAGRLIGRRTGQRGRLPSARIRRSTSTAYYALFHFLLDEAGLLLIGSHNGLRRRRRIFARTFTHAGIKSALDKVRGATIDPSVAEFLRGAAPVAGPLPSPVFAQELARTFADAQAQRHDADYDLNKTPSEKDAHLIASRIKNAIAGWRSARTPAQKDFKQALCMLLLLGGKLR